MTFTDEQKQALQAPLNSKNVKTREQGRSTLSYVESWHVIDEANRIFGFDAWNRETVSATCVSERERKIGKPPYEKDGWGVTYTAKVRVTVGDIVREGTGAGHGIDADLGQAHESAIKEAESDAMKRALMTFGNPFGLALYDKRQANVVDDKPEPQKAAPASSQAPSRDYLAELAEATTENIQTLFAEAWRSTGDSQKKDKLKAAYEKRKLELVKPAVSPDFENLKP